MRNYDPYALQQMARSIQAATHDMGDRNIGSHKSRKQLAQYPIPGTVPGYSGEIEPEKLKDIYKLIKRTKFPKGPITLNETVRASEHGYEDEFAGPIHTTQYLDDILPHQYARNGTRSGYSGQEDRLRDLIKTLKNDYKGLYKLSYKYEDEYQNFLKIQNAIENEKVSNRMNHLRHKLVEEDTPVHNYYPRSQISPEGEEMRQELMKKTIEAAKRDMVEGSGAKQQNFRDVIKEYEKISLSNYQVFDLLNKKTRVLTYTELTNHNDIADVLSPHGSFVLLYLSKSDYGHWCCVIQHPDRIEFFDPYGTFIDDELKHISGDFRKKSDQMFPHLTELLYNSGLPIEYNQYRFQKHGKNINTCGRHVSVRILLKHMLLDEYHDFIINTAKKLKTDPDGLVTMLTLYINAKKKKNQ